MGAPSSWWLFAALGATFAGLAGSLAYSQHLASRLDQDAVSIASNASPAIEHLTAARREILRLQLVATSATRAAAEERRPDPSSLADPLARLRREIDNYLALPFYPRERDLYLPVAQAVDAIEARVHKLAAELAAGHGTSLAAERGLSQAAWRADGAIELLVHFNAEQQHRMGIEIPELRVHAANVGNFLQAGIALLGLVLAWIVWRATMRHQALLRQQQQLAEELARGLAAFSSTLEALIRSSLRIFESITTAHDLGKVFQIIADEARLVTNAEYAALGCGADPGRPFDPWVVSGMDHSSDSLGGPPRPVGLLGAIVREGRPLRIADVTVHAAFRGLPPHHPPMGPFLGVPIVDEGSNLANLYLARKPIQPPFSVEDEHVASLLAAYARVAIGHSRLYSQALAATRVREDLLATVSHDLKNPLHVIHLSAEILRKTAGEGTVAELAARISRSVERMTRLVGELLESSKLDAGALRINPRRENVAALVSAAVDILSPLAADKGVRLCAALPPSPDLVVQCERDLFLRVFSNVVGNAIKFSPPGASVTVGADEREGRAHFFVADQGPGMAAAAVSHAFDRYWQQDRRDARGSGLGLFIAKGIVDAHEGKIWITSALGHGTTVHFSVPAAAPSDDAVTAAVGIPTDLAPGARVAADPPSRPH